MATCEQCGQDDCIEGSAWDLSDDDSMSEVREGRVELPRPFGHRILRLVRPGTDLGATCRPVSSGVTLCHPVSFRRSKT
jgi:hypothetical protein